MDISKFKDGLMKDVYRLVDRYIPNAFIPDKDINPNTERMLIGKEKSIDQLKDVQ